MVSHARDDDILVLTEESCLMANSGKLAGFYCKLENGHRYVAEIASGEAKSKAVEDARVVDFPVPQIVEELVDVFKVPPFFTPSLSHACHSDARKDATGCEHACSARRQHSRKETARLSCEVFCRTSEFTPVPPRLRGTCDPDRAENHGCSTNAVRGEDNRWPTVADR